MRNARRPWLPRVVAGHQIGIALVRAEADSAMRQQTIHLGTDVAVPTDIGVRTRRHRKLLQATARHATHRIVHVIRRSRFA